MYNWDLYYSLDISWNLLDNLYRDSNLLNYFNDFVLNNNFLNDSLYFFDLLDYSFYSYNFLNNLRHLHYSFNSLNDRHRPLYNSVNNFISDLDVIVYLLGGHYLYLRDYSFYDLFHLNNFGDLNYSFNNFLYNNWYFSDNLNDSLGWHNFFNDNLYLLDSSLDVVYNSLYFYNLLNFNWPLFKPVNNLYLWYLSDDLDYSIVDLRDLDNFLYYSLNWHDLFNNVRNNCWNFQRYIDYFLDLSDLFDFYYFFNNLFDYDNLRHFDDSINNFLNYFLNFNDLRHDSKDFKNVINIDNSHDLLVNHTDNSLVNFQHSSSSSFKFLEFLK